MARGKNQKPRRGGRTEPVYWRGYLARYSPREREIMRKLRAKGTPAEELELLHALKATFDATLSER